MRGKKVNQDIRNGNTSDGGICVNVKPLTREYVANYARPVVGGVDRCSKVTGRRIYRPCLLGYIEEPGRR